MYFFNFKPILNVWFKSYVRDVGFVFLIFISFIKLQTNVYYKIKSMTQKYIKIIIELIFKLMIKECLEINLFILLPNQIDDIKMIPGLYIDLITTSYDFAKQTTL